MHRQRLHQWFSTFMAFDPSQKKKRQSNPEILPGTSALCSRCDKASGADCSRSGQRSWLQKWLWSTGNMCWVHFWQQPRQKEVCLHNGISIQPIFTRKHPSAGSGICSTKKLEIWPKTAATGLSIQQSHKSQKMRWVVVFPLKINQKFIRTQTLSPVWVWPLIRPHFLCLTWQNAPE